MGVALPKGRKGQPRGGNRFDKFTGRARRVLELAQDEAQTLNHNYIGTEHLLLGLVRESEGVAAKALSNLGVELGDVRRAVEHIIGRGDHVVHGEVGLTPRAKKVIELAVDEARRLNHNYVGTEHLLLGLIREGEGIAAGVLESLGVGLDQARGQVIRILTTLGHPTEPGGTKGNVVTCRLDDHASDAIDALVEAGIRSTRSDAASWLIAAGIEAHHPLFERVYATVAEIRQLRTEAQAIARQIATGEGRPVPEEDEEPAEPVDSEPS